jgi:choline dehydrogenase-like flavoprotein
MAARTTTPILVRTAVVIFIVSAVLKYVLTPPTCRYCIQPDQLLPEYDFIVIGGGTAGALIAAELSTRLQDATVLLLEAGGFTNINKVSLESVPGLAPLNVQFGSDWKLDLEPQTAALDGTVPHGLVNRQINIPRGKVLGGSNELNYMMHVTATDGDYSRWANAAQDASWDSDHMRTLQKIYESRGSEDSGRISVGLPVDVHPVSTTWVEAAGQTAHGNMTHCNTGKRRGGCHYEHSIRNGVRESTARAFLLPAMAKNKNLHVLLNAHVAKIHFEGLSADTVSFILASSGNRIAFAKAKREVIISAGAYLSPQLLMLSGIGPQGHLESVGIKTVMNLPGVGSHLQDHPFVPLKIRFGEVGGTWWPTTFSKLTALGNPTSFSNYIKRAAGPMASSNVDFGAFLHSNETFATNDQPDLQIVGMLSAGDSSLLNDAFKLRADVMGSATVGSPADWSIFSDGIALGAILLHPNSQGSIRLRDSDPLSKPIISFEGFGDSDDLSRLLKCISVIIEILQQPSFKKLSPVVLYQHDLAKEFGEGTDKYWVEYAKRVGMVIFHPTGTCKMGSADDDLAVVDSKLKVFGMKKLRVADASIMPEITSGNTNNPTALIGLKLVQILYEEYTSTSH